MQGKFENRHAVKDDDDLSAGPKELFSLGTILFFGWLLRAVVREVVLREMRNAS
jgi:hypothetical protein